MAKRHCFIFAVFLHEPSMVSLLPWKALLLYSIFMDIREFDQWCRSFLKIDDLVGIDDSLNGIQIGRSLAPVRKVAFTVDACQESIQRAVQAGADVLFVHHGLFWGKPERIEGSLLKRLKTALDADLALYACHLPLDMHPEVGNNAVLSSMLNLQNRIPFGIYHGIPIGFSGSLPSPLSLEEIRKKLLPDNSSPRLVIPGSRKLIETAAVISGGAPFESFQAISKNIDLYITGEPSHSIYHQVVENGLAFMALGHYASEVWGVKAVAEKLTQEKSIETFFIDLPTGL